MPALRAIENDANDTSAVIDDAIVYGLVQVEHDASGRAVGCREITCPNARNASSGSMFFCVKAIPFLSP